jgi:hypothetical protein
MPYGQMRLNSWSKQEVDGAVIMHVMNCDYFHAVSKTSMVSRFALTSLSNECVVADHVGKKILLITDAPNRHKRSSVENTQ